MVLFAALIACTALENPAAQEVLDAQLEALVVNTSGEGGEGLLTIEGEGADFVITTPAEFTVHSPARADLSPWAEQLVTVQARQGSEDWTGSMGIEVSDEAGAIWLAEPGIGSVFAESRFGAAFATYGEALGEEQRGNYIVTYASVVFQTDEGEVEAAAGKPVTLVLGGLTYRATVITAYTSEEAPGAPQYDCIGKPPLLSYELVRVDAPATWEPVLRPASLEVADIPGCGDE